MKSIIEDLRVLGETTLDDKVLGTSSLYKTRFAKPDVLYSTMTWLTTNYFRQFPLIMMTEGAAIAGKAVSKQAIKSDKKALKAFEYEFDIMGEIDKNEVTGTSLYTTGDKPGYGHSNFKIRFRSNWFPSGYVIEGPGPRYTQILLGPAVQVGSEFEYDARLVTPDYEAFCPLEDLAPNVEYSVMFSPHSEDDSQAPDGFGRILPGRAQNNLMKIRDKYEWKGNVANRALTIQVPSEASSDGKVTGMSNYIIDYDLILREFHWNMQKETAYWYSIYNRQPDGTFALRERVSSEPIKIGAGLLQQIPNILTGPITYNKLRTAMYDLYAQSKADMGTEITLMTGLGGLWEMHEACKDYVETIQWNTTNDKVVTGSDQKLGITGYFTQMTFIGGFKVNVIHNPVFDLGKRATKDPIHPKSGFPLESHRMIFIDSNNFDGNQNLTCVYEPLDNGQSMMEKHIAGMNAFPKQLASSPNFITHEGERSASLRMETLGIMMRYPARSLHVVPTLD